MDRKEGEGIASCARGEGVKSDQPYGQQGRNGGTNRCPSHTHGKPPIELARPHFI